MRKNFKLLFLALSSVLLLNTACSKKDGPAAPDTNSDSQWTLGTHTYTRGGSSQDGKTDQDNDGEFVSVVVSTSGDGGNYGAYSGSAISFIFPNHLGAGTYTLTSSLGVAANPSSKVMEVFCTVGTAVNTGAVSYISTEDGAVAELTIDKDGKYHINITKAVKLTKENETGGGIDDAEDSYSLTVKNGY